MTKHTDWKIVHRYNGTFIESSRGLVASLEAGFQQTRDADAKLIVDAINHYDSDLATVEKKKDELLSVLKTVMDWQRGPYIDEDFWKSKEAKAALDAIANAEKERLQ